MTEDDFVENTGSSPSAYQTVELTLYFANESGDKLVPQKFRQGTAVICRKRK